ncbi:MAG TPA: hypothetical protein VGO35_00400 [Gammaproteobacteria bacterium]|nr:hypothetical protein [Gammaproteobacteria bacterium]
MSISPLIVADLEVAPGEFERLLETVPPAAWDFKPADWAECPGERFSLRENLCHLRDIEIDGYQERLRRTREERFPTCPPWTAMPWRRSGAMPPPIRMRPWLPSVTHGPRPSP